MIDVDYAKAPKHKFPVAFTDAVDVVDYIKANKELYDLSHLTIGGQSSGGNLALAVAAHLKGTFKGVISMYSVTDFVQPLSARSVPKIPKGCPGQELNKFTGEMVERFYLPEGVDRSDPRLSPLQAPGDAFPPATFMVLWYSLLDFDTVTDLS